MDFAACFEILTERRGTAECDQHSTVVLKPNNVVIDTEMLNDQSKDELVQSVFECHYDRVQLYRTFQQDFVKHQATKTFESFGKYKHHNV